MVNIIVNANVVVNPQWGTHNGFEMKFKYIINNNKFKLIKTPDLSSDAYSGMCVQ